jgi:hypothetical protein
MYGTEYYMQYQTSAPNQASEVPYTPQPNVPIGVSPQVSGDITRKPPGDSYTVNTYDSKPPACESLFISEATSNFTYQVPDGKILMLKSIAFMPYEYSAVFFDSLTNGFMRQFDLYVTIDDNAVNFHAGDNGLNKTVIDVRVAYCSRATVSLFIPINSGSVLNIYVKYSDVNANLQNADLLYTINGDLINASGRSPTQEFGNYAPLPVMKGNTL